MINKKITVVAALLLGGCSSLVTKESVQESDVYRPYKIAEYGEIRLTFSRDTAHGPLKINL